MADLGTVAGASADAGAIGAILAMMAGFLVVFIILSIVLWIYLALAFSAIGKKAGVKYPGLAWIPGIGPALVAFNASGMHWWPWLLLIGYLIPIVSGLFSLAFAVVTIIWMWKTFEEIGKPGWWAILMLIPIVNLIIVGMAAWSKK